MGSRKIVITGVGTLADPVSYFNEIWRRSNYITASDAMRKLGYRVEVK